MHSVDSILGEVSTILLPKLLLWAQLNLDKVYQLKILIPTPHVPRVKTLTKGCCIDFKSGIIWCFFYPLYITFFSTIGMIEQSSIKQLILLLSAGSFGNGVCELIANTGFSVFNAPSKGAEVQESLQAWAVEAYIMKRRPMEGRRKSPHCVKSGTPKDRSMASLVRYGMANAMLVGYCLINGIKAF